MLNNAYHEYESLLAITVILLLYLILLQMLERFRVKIVSEAGLGILVGILFGWFMSNFDMFQNFSSESFFEYLLPLIMFSTGYNLQKEKVFRNFAYIIIYSFLGSLLQFITIYLIMGGLNSSGLFHAYGGSKVLSMNSQNLLYFSATMCASDEIIALTVINPHHFPALYSISFGEGLLNDATAVILFQSTATALTPLEVINLTAVLNLLLAFIQSLVMSVLIGIGTAILMIVLLFRLRAISKSPVAETIYILLFSYLTYLISEACDYSGVISLLTCGIMQSHYIIYNLSAVGKVAAAVTVQTLSKLGESYLFIYLGLSSWSLLRGTTPTGASYYSYVSFEFAGYGLASLIVGRLVCIFFVSGAFRCCLKNWSLTLKEIWVIYMTGIVRGVVAFALVQRLDMHCHEEDQSCLSQEFTLRSSVMFIVIVTTIVIGMAMPKLIDCVMKSQMREIEAASRGQPSQIQSVVIQDMNDGEASPAHRKEGCMQKLKQLDEQFLKPCLIYNYGARKGRIKKEKMQLKQIGKSFSGRYV